MAEAPKPQRRRRRQRRAYDITSAAPTADATPSGIPTVTVGPRRRRNRRRRTRPNRFGNTEIIAPVIGGNGRVPFRRRFLTRAIKRELKNEGLEGPKVSVQQKITSTFGQIGPNTTGNAELELNFFLHPALAKEANDGTAFGPLQALAAQYSLWKIKHLILRFTPMVGASAVSGTVVRASLNLSQSPGGSNWSGLGTRLHMDMHPGQVATFRLRGDQVGGPRDGGWWFTDTNEEGSQSAGPIIEVHTLGQTKSTFRAEDWKGPLFLVEGIGIWQFANYQVKPALGTLSRHEGETKAQLVSTAGGPIILDLPDTSDVAVYMNRLEPETNAPVPAAQPSGGPTVGETIFQIVDAGAGLVSSVAPPPFGWLIKGGWWFVKKLIGRTRATGRSSFVVYASLQDAQNNKPAIATQTIGPTASGSPLPYDTRLIVTQMNTPNVGPNPSYIPTPRGIVQDLTPGQSFRLHSSMISDISIDFTSSGAAPNSFVPVSAIPGVLRSSNGQQSQTGGSGGFIQTPWWIGVPGSAPHPNNTDLARLVPSTTSGGYIHSLYRLIDPHFTDQSGDIDYRDPSPSTDVNFCALNSFANTGVSGQPYAVYGKVVATNSILSGGTFPLHMIFTLIRVTNEYSAASDTVQDLLGVLPGQGTTADPEYKVHFVDVAPAAGNMPILERRFPVDQYLLGVSYTDAPGNVHGVDIPTTINTAIQYSRIESPLGAIFPYYLAGQMFPASSVDITLKYVDYHPPSEELLSQLRNLNVRFDVPELPPLEFPLVPDDIDLSSLPSGSGHGPSLGAQGDAEESSDIDSVEDFVLALGNEMIDLPSRWSNNPEIMRMLELQ